MKNKLTNNLGLKIVSLFAAFFLWLVVVNIDDPVISRTYTGIDVDFVNTEVLANDGKSYEVLNNTDVVNVVVSAKRSVLDEISKDDIKAMADFSDMNHNGTVPIEVRCSRYSDRIDSVSTRTENLVLMLEDIIEKSVPVTISYEGTPANGYVVAAIDTSVKLVNVKGPQSIVDSVFDVAANVNIEGIKKDTLVTQSLNAVTKDGKLIDDDRLSLSENISEISFVINAIKEIPISCGYEGNPLNGYAVAGAVMTNPSSVRITGRGENFDDIDVIYISPDDVDIEGASNDIITQVDISDYLPTGVVFADADFDSKVEVTVDIEATEHKVISVPTSNITLTNIPEGYIASIVDIGGSIDVEIQGLGDTYERYSGDLAIGTIDVGMLLPRNPEPDFAVGNIQVGENDGYVQFDFPAGITTVTPVSMMVIVDHIGEVTEDTEDTEETVSANRN